MCYWIYGFKRLVGGSGFSHDLHSGGAVPDLATDHS